MIFNHGQSTSLVDVDNFFDNCFQPDIYFCFLHYFERLSSGIIFYLIISVNEYIPQIIRKLMDGHQTSFADSLLQVFLTLRSFNISRRQLAAQLSKFDFL